jgi:hypothetical protein
MRIDRRRRLGLSQQGASATLAVLTFTPESGPIMMSDSPVESRRARRARATDNHTGTVHAPTESAEHGHASPLSNVRTRSTCGAQAQCRLW